MSFKWGDEINTHGDLSGAAMNAHGSEKIEWATLLAELLALLNSLITTDENGNPALRTV